MSTATSEQMTQMALIGEVKAVEIYGTGTIESLLAAIETEVRSHVPDVGTSKGRTSIASLARKVASSKVHLDNLGKDLVADWKKKSAAVDAERKLIRDRLDALKDEARKPLTDWERAEEDRKTAHATRIRSMKDAALVAGDSMTIRATLAMVEETAIGPAWEEFELEAGRAKEFAVLELKRRLHDAATREAEQAELARLRKAEEERMAKEDAERRERERRDYEEQIRREASERAQREADAAKAEAERVKAQAEARAKREAEEAVARERARVEAEQRAAAEAEAKRRQNLELQSQVHDRIRAVLVNHVGLNVETADEIIAALVLEKIPHVRIIY